VAHAAEGESALFVEDHGEGDGLRAELHREICLILRDAAAAAAHRPTAVRTLRGQRHLMLDIDVRGRPTMRFPAVGSARLATWSLGTFFRQAAGKRRGRPIRPPTRHVECFFQSLVLAPQAVALNFRAQEVFTQLFHLPRLIVDDLPEVGRRRILRAPRHAPVMPDSRAQYKRNPLCLGVSVVRDQWPKRAGMVLTR